MALNFPTSPSNGDFYVDPVFGTVWQYNADLPAWERSNQFVTENGQIVYNGAGQFKGNTGMFFNESANTVRFDNVAVTRNVSAAFYHGDGSKLTNITVDYSPAFNQANTAYIHANNSYNFANTVLVTTQSAYGHANSANLTAGAAYGAANTAYIHANNAYNSSNSVLVTAQAAYGHANSANLTAGAAFDKANGMVMVIAVTDETTSISTGTAKVTLRAPFAMTLTDIPKATLSANSTSGIVQVDINEDGTSILGANKLTIDADEPTSRTAATATTLADTAIADDAQLTIDIDNAGTGAKGLKVYLYYKRT